MEREALERELAALHVASWGWALACCRRDEPEAADVLQDAYAKVLSGRARFGGHASLKTWFFGVIRLTALERRRVSFFRRATPMGEAWSNEPPASGPGADERVAQRQTAERVSRALGALAPRQREVLHLVFYEEMTLAEAAVIMGVSVGSARQHYDRGKQNLHAALERGAS